MRAEAYRYADGDGPKPDELILGDYINRFGAQAILGRTLSNREARSIVVAENIVNAYRNRQAAPDWVKWESDHPDEAAMLNYALKVANNGE